MTDLDQIAATAAEDFCEKHGLREHFIKQDLTRAFKVALEKVEDEAWQCGWDDAIRACKPAAAAKWLAQDRAAQEGEK